MPKIAECCTGCHFHIVIGIATVPQKVACCAYALVPFEQSSLIQPSGHTHVLGAMHLVSQSLQIANSK